MTTRFPSAARAARMRSCTSSAEASRTTTGSGTCSISFHYRAPAGGGRIVIDSFVVQRMEIPEGLRVFPDGSWRVGENHVIHPRSLRYFKSHLVREPGGVFIVDGPQRMAVMVDGPAFQVLTLVLDEDRQEARLVLDDGTV